MGLIGEFQAASDRSRISAQQNAEVVHSLFHQFLGRDHRRLSLLNQQLRLVDIGNRVLSAFEADDVEPDALFLGGDGLLGNNQLVIQFAEQEIVTGHSRDQGDDDHASGVFGAQKDGAGLLRGAAILPPEIDNVAQAETQGVNGRRSPELPTALVGRAVASGQGGELICPGDGQVGAWPRRCWRRRCARCSCW